MKLKVHAQRKFAQGAFIPPSASANAVERRVDVTPSKEENKNVYYNRMSAVSLLDIVAFQNMHSHTEPVVLLERLEELQESSSQPAAEVNGTHTSPPKNGTATANGTASHAKSKPTRSLRYIRPKRTGVLNQRAQRQSMHLRSRLGATFKPKARTIKKKCAEKPLVAARALRRRPPSPTESYDQDDDKPLTYIAQVLRRTGAHARRKRRGEELASTSKRRARVPIPARPPKPTKPSVPKAPPKSSQESDSEDTDSGATNRPPKPKQAVTRASNAANGFRVNEASRSVNEEKVHPRLLVPLGASTSKQLDAPPRDLGNRPTSDITDAGRSNASTPTSETSSDRQTRARATPSRSSRVLPMTRKDNRKCTSLAQPMSKSKHLKLNKIQKAKTAIQSKIINESKVGPRAQKQIKKDIKASRPQTAAQNRDRDVKAAASPSSSTQTNETDAKNIVKPQTVTQIEVDNDITKAQPSGQNNDQGSTSQAQPMTRNNDHKLRSSSRVQPIIHEHETRAQSNARNNNNDLKNNPQGQLNQTNDHKLRSSTRVQLSTPVNDHRLRSTTRGQTISQSRNIDPGDAQPAPSTSQSIKMDLNDVHPIVAAPSTSQSNLADRNNTSVPSTSTGPQGSTQSQPKSQNDLNPRSNSRAQTRYKGDHRRSGTRILLASKNNPYYLKNSSGSRYRNIPSQGSSYGLGGNHGTSSMSRNNNPESSSSSDSSSSSRNQPLTQMNEPIPILSRELPKNVASSTRTQPAPPSDARSSLLAPSSSQLNIQNNTLAQRTIEDFDLNLLSIHLPSTSRSDGSRPVAQVLPIRQTTTNNDTESQPSSPPAQTSGQNIQQSEPNETSESSAPPSSPATDSETGETTQPTVQNNTALRTTVRVDDVELRRNLRAQLLMHDLDLRVNSRPLSAIQNYDWDFSGSRNPPRFHNNFLGLRRDFRARNAANIMNQQRTNTRIDLTVRNDLAFGSRLLPPVQNADVEPSGQTRNLFLDNQQPSTSTARPSTQITDLFLGSSSGDSVLRDDVSRTSRVRPVRNIDLGFGSRPSVRGDSFGRGWVRPSFRHEGLNRVRSVLLNDEIRPRNRTRPHHGGDLDVRVPIRPVRDQARYWNMDSGDRSRQQQRSETAPMNRVARSERIATSSADRERAMTLDEALRECVLTAQTVTAEEDKPNSEGEEKREEDNADAEKKSDERTGMQRRQAIAARQQQLAEGSHLSRRNVTRRVPHTETSATIPQRVPRKFTPSPPPEPESDPEPGPSKLRRKRTSSPSDPGCHSQTRSSGSESEPKEAHYEPEMSKLRRKKPSINGSGDSSTITQRQETESKPKPESKPQPDPEPEPGPSKVRKMKSNSSPGDAGVRSSDSETEQPTKPRRKRALTLLGSMRRRRSPDRLPHVMRKPPPQQSATVTKPQATPKDTKTAVVKTDSPTPSTSSWLPTHVESANDRDIEIPAEGLARCATTRRPIVEGWLKNVLRNSEESPHFKVPRIPAARKSTEKRPKTQGSEKDDVQATPPESNATPTEPDDDEITNPKVFTVTTKRDLPFPSRENLAEPIIQPKNACLSKHFTTVRSIVHATDSELTDRCGHCIYCTRVDKIRKLSNMVQNQRKPAVATNEVYDFDADREDSHENTRLYNFRQNRKAKLLEPPKDAPKDPVYLDVLPPQNPHIIEITSVPMPNQSKPMLRARLIRKTDANLENEFSLIEHENLLDQLLEIKIANSDQTAKKPTSIEVDEPVAGPSNAEPVHDVPDSNEDVELNYETDDSTEFLARLQTRLNTRRRTEQTSARAKEKATVTKRGGKAEAKKSEPAKKPKPPRRNNDEPPKMEPPKNIIIDNNLSSCFREAPVFFPTEEEFMDPIAYFQKIFPVASQFGLCKVVAPSGFKSKCTITDDVRFNVANQYIARLYCRWGAGSKEMCAIKAYLAEQKVFFTRPPLIDGIELNLPKLYRTVQRHGGLKKVIEKKRWGRVAEDMRFPRGPRSAKRIDQIYVKHLLPYDTLSNAERRELMDTVESSWRRNYKKMMTRATNPLHRQKRMMGESDSSDEVDTDEDANLAYALAEAEDCVVSGRCMKLGVFKKVATNVLCTLFPNSKQPTPAQVEAEYWSLVSGATEHICVNAASIDTGEEGYGFPRNKQDPGSRHPWNLKMFSQNDGNVLRSLGPVLGVTVPTLHLGMVFSTSCWHRDPHGLPWLEYVHHGPPKIWYGIPDELSSEFRKAVETLCPTSCQNKSIWLPSDITMIPPPLLREARVPLSRAVQGPGEFIVVCPKAYSSSIATGYTESESVYFAPIQWLADVAGVFQELRKSCEPSMFSLAQLLLAVALDMRTPAHVLPGVYANLRDVVLAELARRDVLMCRGVEMITPEINRTTCNQARKRPAGAWNVREQDECEVCRATLYLSKVTGLTSKRSSLCLEHALILMDKDYKDKKRSTYDIAGVVATIFVLRGELEDAMKRVERRLEKLKV